MYEIVLCCDLPWSVVGININEFLLGLVKVSYFVNIVYRYDGILRPVNSIISIYSGMV